MKNRMTIALVAREPTPLSVQARATARRKVHSLAAEQEPRLVRCTTFCTNLKEEIYGYRLT